MRPRPPQKAHSIIIPVCSLISSFTGIIQNPQVPHHFCVRPHLLICRYNIESSAFRICPRYPVEVECNREQVKILTAKFIDNMPILTCLLDFETPKNSHLHHGSLKTRKMRALPTTKSLLHHHSSV